MSYRTTEWPWLIIANPDEARARMLKAYKAAYGNITAAAKLLGVSRRTWYYCAKKLSLAKTLYAKPQTKEKE